MGSAVTWVSGALAAAAAGAFAPAFASEANLTAINEGSAIPMEVRLIFRPHADLVSSR